MELSIQYPGDIAMLLPLPGHLRLEAVPCADTSDKSSQDAKALFKALSISEKRICTNVNCIVKFCSDMLPVDILESGDIVTVI